MAIANSPTHEFANLFDRSLDPLDLCGAQLFRDFRNDLADCFSHNPVRQVREHALDNLLYEIVGLDRCGRRRYWADRCDRRW